MLVTLALDGKVPASRLLARISQRSGQWMAIASSMALSAQLKGVAMVC